MSKHYWIPGRPATFATSREVPWKSEIVRHIGNHKNENDFLDLQFKINHNDFQNYALDIDNLCDPVFSTLASKLKWYGGKQTNITGWRARKIADENQGLLLTDVEQIDFHIKNVFLFDEIYKGKFPKGAREPEIPNWLSQFENMKEVIGKCGIALQFGTSKLSVATISGGIVKPIIDCLYPILGGKVGFPEDHKIIELTVQKCIKGLTEDEVRITVFQGKRKKESFKSGFSFKRLE